MRIGAVVVAFASFAMMNVTELVAGPAPANLTREEAEARKARVSDVAYGLRLELVPKSTTYRAEATIRFTVTGSGPLGLDFQGEEVLAVEVGGRDLTREAPYRDGRIRLPASAVPPGAVEVKVTYRNEFDSDGAGLHKIVDPADGREYFYTQFEPFDANRLLPCFDQADLKATWSLTVVAPADWHVIGNAPAVSIEPAGEDRVHVFEPSLRLSPYVFSVCAGPFAVWTDVQARIPSRIFALQSMARYVDAEEIFTVTRQGFDFFEDYFGIPYPYLKYDQVFVPQFNWGAMENVASVIWNDGAIFRHRPTERELMDRADTLLHEMAHMWFGNLVTFQWWGDLWLNESFATYMAQVGLVRATRYKAGWEAFARETKGWAYWQDSLVTTHPIETEVPDTTNAFTNFDGITYGKGASVLKQLAFFVGEDAFRRGVSDYLKAHQWGNARLADFMGAIAKASGKDLTDWTRLWLEKSGVNTIVPVWTEEDFRIGELKLVQKPGNGDAVLRPHRLKLALFGEGGRPDGPLALMRVVDVTLDGAERRVPELDGALAPLFVFANHEDHAYAKVALDPKSLEFATRSLERLPGSMLRAAVWQAVWFMVRDQDAPPTRYLDLFLAKAGLETDDKLISGLLFNLGLVFDQYLPERERAEYQARVNALAWERLAAAAPGDLQKAWYELAVATSEDRPALDRLLALLEAREVLPGLEIDQDKRWKILVRLSAFGHPAAPALLEAEKRRDGTDRGVRAAFRAWVATPSAAVKAEAWKRFTTDTKSHLDLLREGMKGFWWPHQQALTGGYTDRFFRDLPGIAAGRDLYFVESFVEQLFPSKRVEPAVLADAKGFLGDKSNLPSNVRRSLTERIDELDRAIRIRATVGPGAAAARKVRTAVGAR